MCFSRRSACGRARSDSLAAHNAHSPPRTQAPGNGSPEPQTPLGTPPAPPLGTRQCFAKFGYPKQACTCVLAPPAPQNSTQFNNSNSLRVSRLPSQTPLLPPPPPRPASSPTNTLLPPLLAQHPPWLLGAAAQCQWGHISNGSPPLRGNKAEPSPQVNV